MVAPQIHKFRPAAIGVLLAVSTFGAAAQGAGEVEFSRGVGFAQTAGQVPRTLGKGLTLKEGDRLTTSDGASAIIKMEDGTRMTVRPNSEIVLQQYKFRENAPDNGMLMQLVRGGFRAVTGLIAKGSPNAAKVQTNTATIGIRGTDFDARVCSRDCGTESAAVSESSRPNAVQASAKVVSSQGTVNAVDAAGQRRRLVNGGSVYPGDLVETSGATQAVLAFRDDTRITLGSTTRFRVDNFVYDTKNAGEGRFLASVLRGSVRALTGLIAKANNRNVGFNTATATIGIRGTGLDINCTSRENSDTCEDLTLWTWLGSIAVNRQGDTALQVLQEGQGLQITPTAIRPIASQPAMDGPRPDAVTVPPKLFSGDNVSDNEEGLFVFVRDGHIEIATAGDILHLGKGEAGFAGVGGETKRPISVPKFLEFDKTPLPSSRNPLLVSVLAESGVKAGGQCK
ncbi:FecR domain-containing protein [Caenimonas sp. SL110]|uniref:FecR family protein n=1 Tax=Caenimonas sp. SL110 TaxID=1450524 RepID=UPI00069EE4CC|nr:FecR domain-containing protein [Caenimonas sp. SL110]